MIEMVGVLAVIAILAALLVPKIFAAIEESRITNAVGSVNSVKAATMSYFAKNGGFVANATFDKTMIQEGQLERLFTTRLGTAWACEVVAKTDAGLKADTKRFDTLDGAGGTAAASGNIVQCKLTGVKAGEAWELSKALDGTSATMSEADATTEDINGRVIYGLPAGGVTDVYVYIAHK